jgi:hypothetical protein
MPIERATAVPRSTREVLAENRRQALECVERAADYYAVAAKNPLVRAYFLGAESARSSSNFSMR